MGSHLLNHEKSIKNLFLNLQIVVVGCVVEYYGDALIGVPLYHVKGIDSQTEKSINERGIMYCNAYP
jgi:hypothetical protein